MVGTSLLPGIKTLRGIQDGLPHQVTWKTRSRTRFEPKIVLASVG